MACVHPRVPSIVFAAEADKVEDEDEDEDDGEEGDDDAFNWVFVALMSDGTLRQYTNEMMDEELCAAAYVLALYYALRVELAPLTSPAHRSFTFWQRTPQAWVSGAGRVPGGPS